MKKPVIVAITGASGAIYGARLIGRLIEDGIETHLIISQNGKKLVNHELGFDPTLENIIEYTSQSLNITADRSLLTILNNEDLSSAAASGNSNYGIMVVVPCSMNTLSSVATGRAANLIERTASVMLKEKRKLILVPRETPLSVIHMKNMLSVSEAGGTILPAMPAYYFKPAKIEDLADFIISKIFHILGFQSPNVKFWQGSEPELD